MYTMKAPEPYNHSKDKKKTIMQPKVLNYANDRKRKVKNKSTI